MFLTGGVVMAQEGGPGILGTWEGTVLSQVAVSGEQAQVWLGHFGVYFSAPRPAAGHGDLGAVDEPLFSPLTFTFAADRLRISEGGSQREVAWRLHEESPAAETVRLVLDSPGGGPGSLYLSLVSADALLFALVEDDRDAGLTVVLGTLSRATQ